MGVGKILVYFFWTNKPFRYIRVARFDVGKFLTLDFSNLREARALEMVNPVGFELPYGTADLKIYSEDDNFSITNPQGYYYDITQNQPIYLYEIVDGTQMLIGHYFMDNWESPARYFIDFHLIDALGLIGENTYYGGILSGITVQNWLSARMAELGMAYELDSALAPITLNGWIPICSYREALQEVALAIGAIVKASRYGGIAVIKAPDYEIDQVVSEIGREEMNLDSPTRLRKFYSGVEVIAHAFRANTGATAEILFNEPLPVGQHPISWGEPKHSLSISGGTIVSSSANHVIVNVSAAGTVLVQGKPYWHFQSSFKKINAEVSTGAKQNVPKVDQAYLVNLSNVSGVRDRIYNYLMRRYTQKTKLIAPLVESGDLVKIATPDGKQIKGVVESMNMNLSGGYVTEVEISGDLVNA